MSRDIPPQEQNRKWFRSHLLNRELELQELYDLPQNELDLLMAETAEIRSDPENRSRSHGRWCTAGYVLELAKIIDARRVVEWFCSSNQINAEVARLLALMQEGGLIVLTVYCLVFAFISAFDVFT